MKNLIFIPLCLSFLLACQLQNPLPTEEQLETLSLAQANFKPLPDSLIDRKTHHDLIELGRKLYHEEALSRSGTISCNSCHQLDQFGVDNLKTSPGHDGTLGGRNSPTVYNAALHTAQFWDGRAASLKEQALGPLLNPIEHGLSDEAQVLTILKQAGYEEQFKQAFQSDQALSFNNVGLAIEAFEKTLLTPSRFDDYLNGDVYALKPQEIKGMKKFVEVGCTVCHSGPAVGGEMFQKLGLVEDYPTTDLGRFEVTGQEEDKFVFKVPGLRNVVHTYPYFHDGSIAGLEEAVKVMGHYQLGVVLSDEDTQDIIAFLGSLSAKE